MNKAITDGLNFMPPAFIDGLANWSSADGTPGSASYSGAANAALVASDPDFGPCLELQKTSTLQKLRYMGDTPLLPGCYLQVKIRFKVLSGLFPSCRVGAWAGAPAGTHVAGLVETGPAILPDTYGRIYEVSAIVGTGDRTGVDMVWGTEPVFGHFGLDMTGDNGAVVRIESVVIEDKTDIFHRKLMGWVDVRDYGAIGDGITDDRLAFLAADAAAQGREVVVSEGSYFIGSSLTINSPVRFEGQLLMPSAARLLITSNFEYKTYEAAFGNEREALTRALAALFNYTDHDSLDLGGRRIQLDSPIDVHAAVGKNNFANRRVIRNGQLEATNSAAWDTVTVTSSASWASGNPTVLTGVTNVINIAVGSLLTGNGVGREVYVASKDDAAQTITLSQSLINPAANQVYTFDRFQYLLDFSGFNDLSRLQITNMEFACLGKCSGVLLPYTGFQWHIHTCWFLKPKDRGITSYNRGCYGISIYNNEFYSNEYHVLAQNRTTVAFNTNFNDTKIRDNQSIRFKHFGVMAGAGHMITGNHFWQGDGAPAGDRTAGIVFTGRNCNSVVTGNYVDNSFLEVSNEHAKYTNVGANTVPFGSLSVTGNVFVVSDVPSFFTFIRLSPHGTGHHIDGISVVGNTFKEVTDTGTIDRVESVVTANGNFDHALSQNIVFEGNTFYDVLQRTENPAYVDITQAGAAVTWTFSNAQKVPFGGQVRGVEGWSAIGPIRDAGNIVQFDTPFFSPTLGAAGDSVSITWPAARKGRVQMKLRSDSAA